MRGADRVVTDAAPEVTDAGPPGAEAPGIRPARATPRRLAAPLVALALALLALGAVAGVSLGENGARERDARTATAAARSALEQLLSYDGATVAAQAGRNAALLTGPFRTEYGTTMTSRIVPLAQKQQAVVRARAYEAGVMSQTDDSVRVQVFLNQARTTPEQKTPAIDQNRVIATMQRVGGRWLVAGLEAY